MKKLFKILPKRVQKKILQFLYSRKGKKFEDFEVYGDWKFFIYRVDGYSIPSESLGWFVDYEYYKKRLFSMPAFFYKPKEGDIILDIGAGMGEETLVFANMIGKKGKVFSIEANPMIFKILTRVLELNKISNVITLNAALSESDSPIAIHVNDISYLGGSIGNTNKNKLEKTFQVKGIRLDTFLTDNGIEKVDLLKVNIEGAERYLINTMSDCLDRINNIAIECHDFRFAAEKNEFFKTKALLRSYLEKKNFHVFSQQSGVSYIDDWIYAYRLSNN